MVTDNYKTAPENAWNDLTTCVVAKTFPNNKTVFRIHQK